jgi:predicted XRE-type DNA-binding protein
LPRYYDFNVFTNPKRIVERRKLTQIEVAAALGINQPKVSALLHYKLEGFPSSASCVS